jgi:hypothetical protein
MKRIVETEAYYTSDSLANKCVDLLRTLEPIERFSYILEPSAGAGAFLRALPGVRIHAIDIEPRGAGIERSDFFWFEPPLFKPNILVIGNPPFGQRGALVMRFMDRAMEFASTVAFILPRSFKKHTFLNRVDRAFHLAAQIDCSDFVTPEGTPIEVRCVFQVWQRRHDLRPLVELPTTHPHFEMRHFHLSRTSPKSFAEAALNYDFAIAQVGANFIPKDIRGLTEGSQWFIKALAPGVLDVFRRLDFSFLDGLNTAHKSLSKRDIISAYITALKLWNRGRKPSGGV